MQTLPVTPATRAKNETSESLAEFATSVGDIAANQDWRPRPGSPPFRWAGPHHRLLRSDRLPMASSGCCCRMTGGHQRGVRGCSACACRRRHASWRAVPSVQVAVTARGQTSHRATRSPQGLAQDVMERPALMRRTEVVTVRRAGGALTRESVPTVGSRSCFP